MTGDHGGTRCAWFQCFAGIAGDMALGSLVDAGAQLDLVLELVGRLPITGWRVERREVQRGGIACTRLEVVADDDGSVRRHADIAAMIEAASLPARVTRRSLAVFAALAAVEGRIHGMPADQVHFHEVGGHDAVVDVVGTAAALEVLEVGEVRASPVAVGSGVVRTAHGTLPNPAPAVVMLLRGAPVQGLDLPQELTTPTGAALLTGLGATYGPLPAMVVERSGFGAGARELAELPNCTQVVVGQLADRAAAETGQALVVLETNIDDATGEQLAVAVEDLLAAGALDAWLTPVVMKKGRPAHTLHALADPAVAATLRRVLRRATGSFGVRAVPVQRWPVARRTTTVTVAGYPIRLKVSAERAKPEWDDVRRAAEGSGMPVHEVQARAQAAWLADPGSGEDQPAEL